MKKSTAILAATALLGAVGASLPAGAATTVYSDQATFAAQLASSITDNYENPGYAFFQSDAQMTAVLGETSYTATGFANVDIVNPIGSNHFYCAGCNGSFKLGFADTSVSAGGGVYGVGFDLFANANYDAHVTFADGTATTFALPTNGFFVTQFAYWGITSDLGIASIYIGKNGAPATDGTFGVDNLLIGSAPAGPGPGPGVPEPSAWVLMLVGFGALGGALRRRRRVLASA